MLTGKPAAAQLTEEPLLNLDTKAFYSQTVVVSPSAARKNASVHPLCVVL